jgi:hypothetical protein
MMGAVGFANTGGFSGVLKTLAGVAGHELVRPGARGIDNDCGHETGNARLSILCLTEGQKSS